MTSLAQIQAAVCELPRNEQSRLRTFLDGRLRGTPAPRARKGLKAAERPGLDGLPSDLSVNVKEKVRASLRERYAAGR